MNFFLLTVVPLTPTTVTGPVVAPAGTVAVTGPNGTGTSSKVFKVEI